MLRRQVQCWEDGSKPVAKRLRWKRPHRELRRQPPKNHSHQFQEVRYIESRALMPGCCKPGLRLHQRNQQVGYSISSVCRKQEVSPFQGKKLARPEKRSPSKGEASRKVGPPPKQRRGNHADQNYRWHSNVVLGGFQTHPCVSQIPSSLHLPPQWRSHRCQRIDRLSILVIRLTCFI